MMKQFKYVFLIGVILLLSQVMVGCTMDDIYEKESKGIINFPSLGETDLIQEEAEVPKEEIYVVDEPKNYSALYFANRYDDNLLYEYDLQKNQYRKVNDLNYYGIEGKDSTFYFIKYDEQKSGLYSIDQQGVEKKILDESIGGFKVIEDNVYYYSEKSIYRMDLEGNNKVRMATTQAPVNKIELYGESLFASDGESIVQVNLNDSTKKVITTSNFTDFSVKGNSVYILTGQVHVIDLVSGIESVLIDDIVYSFEVYEDGLYYIVEEGINRFDLITRQTKKMSTCTFVDQFKIISGAIYFYQNNQLWRCSLDLLKKSIIVNEDKSFAYTDEFFEENDSAMIGQIIEQFNVYPDRLYQKTNSTFTFVDASNHLYSYTIASNKLDSMYEGSVDTYFYWENVLYLTDYDSHVLYSLDPSTDEFSVFYEYPVYNPKMADGNLYFTDSRDNYSLIRINAAKERTRLVRGPILQYVVNNDKVYYTDEYMNGRLAILDLTDQSNSLLTNEKVYNLFVDQDELYCLSGDNVRFIYKLTLGDTQPRLVNLAGQFASYIYLIEDTIYVKEEFEDSTVVKSVSKKDEWDVGKVSTASQETTLGEYAVIDNNLFLYNAANGTLQTVDDNRIFDMVISDKYLYYAGFNQNNYSIFIKRIDLSSGKIGYVSLEKEIDYDTTYRIYYYNDYFYYARIDGLDLYRVTEELSDKTQIISGITNPIQFSKNKFYYQDEQGMLAELNLDTGANRVLTGKPINYLGVFKNLNYFLIHDGDNEKSGSLYHSDTTGGVSPVSVVTHVDLANYYYLNNRLYYLNEEGLFLYDFTTNAKELLTDEEVVSFFVGTDIVYYQVKNAQGEMETKTVTE